MDVKLEKWHKCQVNKEVLKELSKKSDLKGLQHVSVFFGLLILTGLLAYIFWGSMWGFFLDFNLWKCILFCQCSLA